MSDSEAHDELIGNEEQAGQCSAKSSYFLLPTCCPSTALCCGLSLFYAMLPPILLLTIRFLPGPSAAEGESGAPTQKRGRGRPKGSKNKKSIAALAADASGESQKPKKRGRPPKVRFLLHPLTRNDRGAYCSLPQEKKDDGEEPAPKRRRGRPPKNPKPDSSSSAAAGTTSADAGPSSAPAPEPVSPSEQPKKRRGRPPKAKADD